MTSNHNISRLPLRALQIFEAAARHQNFTAAGRDLGITQSAVSRKISELEAILGAQLFNRSGPNLSLTRTGRSLAHRVSYALTDLQAACLDARSSPDRGVVTLSMLPSVAAKWLAPRLGQFASLHPEIDLRISASHSLVDFAADGIDGAIRYGRGSWPGLEATWLGSETVQPVCSPAALKDFGISTPSDLLSAPLIHSDIPEDWAAWFAAAGIGDAPGAEGPCVRRRHRHIAGGRGRTGHCARTISACRRRFGRRTLDRALFHHAGRQLQLLVRLPERPQRRSLHRRRLDRSGVCQSRRAATGPTASSAGLEPQTPRSLDHPRSGLALEREIERGTTMVALVVGGPGLGLLGAFGASPPLPTVTLGLRPAGGSRPG